jgi:hypothetical protein
MTRLSLTESVISHLSRIPPPSLDHIEWRYDDATAAIRRDVEARIAASGRANVAQAETGHP